MTGVLEWCHAIDEKYSVGDDAVPLPSDLISSLPSRPRRSASGASDQSADFRQLFY